MNRNMATAGIMTAFGCTFFLGIWCFGSRSGEAHSARNARQVSANQTPVPETVAPAFEGSLYVPAREGEAVLEAKTVEQEEKEALRLADLARDKETEATIARQKQQQLLKLRKDIAKRAQVIMDVIVALDNMHMLPPDAEQEEALDALKKMDVMSASANVLQIQNRFVTSIIEITKVGLEHCIKERHIHNRQDWESVKQREADAERRLADQMEYGRKLFTSSEITEMIAQSRRKRQEILEKGSVGDIRRREQQTRALEELHRQLSITLN